MEYFTIWRHPKWPINEGVRNVDFRRPMASPPPEISGGGGGFSNRLAHHLPPFQFSCIVGASFPSWFSLARPALLGVCYAQRLSNRDFRAVALLLALLAGSAQVWTNNQPVLRAISRSTLKRLGIIHRVGSGETFAADISNPGMWPSSRGEAYFGTITCVYEGLARIYMHSYHQDIYIYICKIN